MNQYYIEFPQGGHTTIEARTMKVSPSGVLMFVNGLELIKAFAPGHWSLCEKMV